LTRFRRHTSLNARRRAKGFVMAEALVALSVAAMTLVLLTSATWGLQHVNRMRADAGPIAQDWLTARRALHAWAAAATTTGVARTEMRFLGTSEEVRMFVPASSAGPTRPYIAGLTVRFDEGTYTLIARRDLTVVDTRMRDAQGQITEILSTNEPIRLMYLMRDRNGPGTEWLYSAPSDLGMPYALGVEVGGSRILTARVMTELSAACVTAFGRGGIENDECEVRL